MHSVRIGKMQVHKGSAKSSTTYWDQRKTWLRSLAVQPITSVSSYGTR